MRTIKLTLAYDGTAYFGWQRQVGKPTIQGELEAAGIYLDEEIARLNVAQQQIVEIANHGKAPLWTFEHFDVVGNDLTNSVVLDAGGKVIR